MKVVIAGAGISGLSLALFLQDLGIESVLYEASAQIDGAGVGINLQPNAVRELWRIGLEPVLTQDARFPEALAFYNKHGQLIISEPRGLKAGFGWPQVSIGRGQLQLALYHEFVRRGGQGRVRVSRRLLGFEQRGARVLVRFADPAVDAQAVVEEVEGDVLIGADGIHSTTRRLLWGDLPAHFNNLVLYRGVVDWPEYLDGRTWAVAGHWHQRVVVYPMGASSRGAAAQARTNWVCALAASRDPRTGENWDVIADKQALLTRFAEWRYDWLDVPAMIAATDVVYQYPAFDRDPLPQWGQGRVTLLGDAAHPMLPIGGQAGSQAILDAAILAARLAEAGEGIETALQAYEQERRDEMNNIVLFNRAKGVETLLQKVEERAPQGFERLRDVISEEELQQTLAQAARITGLDVERVNERA